MSFLQEYIILIWLLPVATHVIIPLAILVVYLIWKTAIFPFKLIGLA